MSLKPFAYALPLLLAATSAHAARRRHVSTEHAAAKTALPTWLYAEGDLAFSYAGPSVSAGSTPALLQMAPGIVLGYRLSPRWVTGLRGDLRFASQVSNYDPAAGDHAGYRWNFVSPFIASRFQRLWLRLDFQFLGSYHLTAQTHGGQSVSYDSPLGLRLEGLYPLPWKGFHALGGFEWVSFLSMTVGGVGGQAPSSPNSLWQAILGGAYVF